MNLRKFSILNKRGVATDYLIKWILYLAIGIAVGAAIWNIFARYS